MKVRLTRKLAEHIDGVDLTRHEVGETLDVPLTEAMLLIAERWAMPARRESDAAKAGPEAAAGSREAHRRDSGGHTRRSTDVSRDRAADRGAHRPPRRRSSR
jgi:hypothetical protein